MVITFLKPVTQFHFVVFVSCTEPSDWPLLSVARCTRSCSLLSTSYHLVSETSSNRCTLEHCWLWSRWALIGLFMVQSEVEFSNLEHVLSAGTTLGKCSYLALDRQLSQSKNLLICRNKTPPSRRFYPKRGLIPAFSHFQGLSFLGQIWA